MAGCFPRMIDPLEILTPLTLAAVLGAVIGVNRGHLEWAVGLRTHMLVSVGAALAMIVSAFGFADVLGHANIVLDPSRIAAQVISGVGFIGAGTILFLQREQVIKGLTTAAGLWACGPFQPSDWLPAVDCSSPRASPPP